MGMKGLIISASIINQSFTSLLSSGEIRRVNKKSQYKCIISFFSHFLVFVELAIGLHSFDQEL